jgi:hypothetical protein
VWREYSGRSATQTDVASIDGTPFEGRPPSHAIGVTTRSQTLWHAVIESRDLQQGTSWDDAMKARFLALLVALSLVAGAQPVAAEQVIGQPEIGLSVQENRLAPGERSTLRITVSNDGSLRKGGPAALEERVKSARGVTVDVLEEQIDAPIAVKSGSVTLGTLPDGTVGTAAFQLETGESLAPGTYRIPVEVSYSVTRSADFEETASPPGYTDVSYADSFRRQTMVVTLVVDREARFEVVAADANAVIAGDTGTLQFDLQNVGSETARKATVSLTARTGDLYFGEPAQPRKNRSVFVEELAPGESEPISVQIGATTGISPGSYPIEIDVAYETPDGVAETSDTLSTGVRVEPERTFDVRDISTSSFRVDEDEATVRATVVNTGDAPARNVVVRTQGPGPLQATAPEAAVGDLAPGESAEMQFAFAVPSDAESGSISLSFAVEYENADGDLRRLDEPIRRAVSLDPERDAFEVVDVETSVAAGGEGTLAVTVRYDGDRPVSNANAKVFVNDPLSSADDGAFLGSFEPGETRTAEFSVTAAGSAMAKEYPASIEVRYDDASGNSKLADGLQFGVPVGESAGGLPLGYVGAGVGVLVLASGVFVWQRQRG